jgi:GxxExxY protein
MLIEESLTEQIIGAAIEVHKRVGPGLPESAYPACLCHELRLRGIPFRIQVDPPVVYKDVRLDCGYRIDLLVREKIVVEIKAVEIIVPVHEAQLLTYMRLGGYRVGLAISFNVSVLKDGIVRRAL